MKRFIARFGDRIIGILNGFDRLVFRGSLRKMAFVEGMLGFLRSRQVLLKDFAGWAQAMTERIEEAALKAARLMDRPVQYVPSSRTDKEALAQDIARKDGITEGLVAVLTCVEPCRTFEIYRNRDEKKLQLLSRERKCKFIYQYILDPEVGWMHARIQTWAPFNIQVCINGREWLSRQMDRQGIAYRRYNNSFPWISDLAAAQELMNQQVKTRWPDFLRRMARRLNPDHGRLFPELDLDYYWTVYQSEWATDVMFKDRSALLEIYPSLIRHGITAFSSDDVMRFLGRRLDPRFDGEVVTSLREREEGVRIKHWVDENALKMYDKWLNLRVEAMFQNVRPYRVFRTKENDPSGAKRWLRLRSGIADLARRVNLSHAANNRYLDAMAAADTSTPLGILVSKVTRRVCRRGRSFRGLRPWDTEDLNLFRAINDGKWAIHGFRNRDLQAALFGSPALTPEDQRRRSARVGRLIALLRSHRLIKKEPRAHRYTVTPHGREIITAILAAQSVSLEELRKMAA